MRAMIMVALLLMSQLTIAEQTPVKTKPAPKTIALTFNDGPDSRYTAKIIDVLERYGVRATFFVVGEKAKRHPELMALIVQKGHVIANHTMTHPKLNKLSQKELEAEVLQSRDVIKEVTGIAPRCFRPPFGMTNPRVRAVVEKHGMKVVNWDLNSFDYKRRGAKWLTNWVLRESKPRSVILMHDGGGGSDQTLEALPGIIEGFQKRGLGFDVICE